MEYFARVASLSCLVSNFVTNRFICASYRAKPMVQFCVIDSMMLDIVNCFAVACSSYAMAHLLNSLESVLNLRSPVLLIFSWFFHWVQFTFGMYQVLYICISNVQCLMAIHHSFIANLHGVDICQCLCQ